MRINIFCSCAENGLQELGEGYLQTVLDNDDKKLSDYNRGRMSFYLGRLQQREEQPGKGKGFKLRRCGCGKPAGTDL